jgi:hypothetical protein
LAVGILDLWAESWAKYFPHMKQKYHKLDVIFGNPST